MSNVYGRQEPSSSFAATFRTYFVWGLYTIIIYQLGSLSGPSRGMLVEDLYDGNNRGTATTTTTTTIRNEDMFEIPSASSSYPEQASTSSSSSSSSPYTGPVVDILSIGSSNRLDLMNAQEQSWGSHVSVRHFFRATESDDSDPYCSTQLSQLELFNIVNFCKRQREISRQSYMIRYLRNEFASRPWLEKKANPSGWMCAQRRPIHGIYKVLKEYEKSDMGLPDRLIVMDDDTYLNLEQLDKLYRDDEPELPLVRAGCLVRKPIMYLNFTFPFGGYGVIFNKPAIEKMMTPIFCPGGGVNDRDICSRIQENLIGENNVFNNGMSLVELMQALAVNQPYRDLQKGLWTNGYCMHSDWTMGYFINFYNITRKSSNDFFASVANDRLEDWLHSVIYKMPRGNCRNSNVDRCPADSLVCHYMTAESMHNNTNAQRKRFPHRFKTNHGLGATQNTS